MQRHAHTGFGGSRVVTGLLLAVAACGEPLAPSMERHEPLVPQFGLGPVPAILIIEDLGPYLGGSSSAANAINNANQITGWRATAQTSSVAYVWTPPGNVTDLGSLGQAPYTSVGHDINEAGVVVGAAGSHAFRWTPPGPMTQLASDLNAVVERAYAINNSGMAVGVISTAAIDYPVRWGSSSYSLLPLPQPYQGYDVTHGQANDINDTHKIVGIWNSKRAFYWTVGPGFTELAELPGSTRSEATAINDAGVIVGHTIVQGQPKAVRWPGHTTGAQFLGTLGGSWSRANDINDAGVIVGTSALTTGEMRAFRLPPNGFPENLGLPFGAIGAEAQGINDDGHIVGRATFPNRVVHAVVWWHYVGNTYGIEADWPQVISRSSPSPFTVALLSTDEFDALQIDTGTLSVGDNVDDDARVLRSADGALAVVERDVDGDGRADLLVSFDGAQLVATELRPRDGVVDLILKGALLDRSRGVYATGAVTVQQ